MDELTQSRVNDVIILVARILLSALFIVFGWSKLTGFSAAVDYMTSTGVPLPALATVVAIVVELLGSLAVLLGLWTRPIALVLAAYVVATGLIGHPFWDMTGAARYGNAINFYKNLCITGGFLLLYVTGAGKYAIGSRNLRSGI